MRDIETEETYSLNRCKPKTEIIILINVKRRKMKGGY